VSALAAAIGVLMPLAAWSHDGEDHGAVAAPVGAPGDAFVAVDGRGESFEGVLKFKPFDKGEKVDLVFYLLSLENNRAVAEAKVSATLSEGASSTEVAFVPKQGGPLGAYTATVTVADDKTRSWLFDVTAGDTSDLIAVGGFQAEEAVEEPHAVDGGLGQPAMSPAAFSATLGAAILLAGASFAFGRMTARRVSA